MAISTGGRPLESGIGSFRLNPQLGRLLNSSMSGLKASKKIRGDRVSPWKTPHWILPLFGLNNACQLCITVCEVCNKPNRKLNMVKDVVN